MSARGALETPDADLRRSTSSQPAARSPGAGGAGAASIALAADDLVIEDAKPALKLTRAQETDLPHQVELGFIDGENEYRRAAVASRRLSGSSRREARQDVAIVTRRAEAQRLADAMAAGPVGRRARWPSSSFRRGASTSSRATSCRLPTEAGPRLHRVVRIADGPTRKITTRAVEPAVFEVPGARRAASAAAPAAGARQAAGGRPRSAGRRKASRRPCNISRRPPIPGPAP